VIKSNTILLVFAITAILTTRGSPASPQLRYVTTAHQAGPVGYRDPVGAVSPDGVWLAYISNRHLFLHRIEASLTTELLPADETKTELKWLADSRYLAVLEAAFNTNPRWFRYEIATGKREPIESLPNPAAQENPPPSISEKIWGPSVFSPDRRTFYYSIANAKGTLDLWSCNTETGEKSQLTQFDRDTYAPSITARGDVVFKTQVYSAFLGMAPAAGGMTRVLTAFQSETPTWSPDGKTIAMTFGPWRRFVDDANYPDIAQHLGIIPFDPESVAEKPAPAVVASKSEDQGMVWSPNGKWIVFHSHRDKTDDLYLQRADGSGAPRRITTGGVETGWPRWSPDGKWIAYSTFPGSRRSTRGRLHVLGIDQDTGEISQITAPIRIEGQIETALDPNWMPDSDHLVFDSSGTIAGRKSLATVSRQGGRARKIIDYASDQVFSGISVSPDGAWVAYVATAPDGTYQIFRVSSAGEQAQQLTNDSNHKTQPAYSPDGSHLAFTVWRYDVQFWMLRANQ
jgi:TolB protein